MSTKATTSRTLQLPEPVGPVLIEASAKGLRRLSFLRTDTPPASAETLQGAAASRAEAHLDAAEAAIRAYMTGKLPAKLPALDMLGTEFQRDVWRAVAKLWRSGPASYAEIAERIGRPAAYRAVGQAVGANPVALLVPCHRVLAANQRLGGFSGGIERKVALLKHEGIEYGPNPTSTQRRKATPSAFQASA